MIDRADATASPGMADVLLLRALKSFWITAKKSLDAPLPSS
jgi:hypothetical protein